MAEMNPRAKAWIEALLSGNYKQGGNCLRDGNNNFCCLGVAADVLKIDEWVLRPTDNEETTTYMLKSSGDWEVLPDPVWKELIAGAPNYNCFDQPTLAELNDAGHTFEQIVNEVILPMWDDPPVDLEEHY